MRRLAFAGIFLISFFYSSFIFADYALPDAGDDSSYSPSPAQEEVDEDSQTAGVVPPESTRGDSSSRVLQMSGHYRAAAGANSREIIYNESNADLQERNFRYLFGERLNNTYDPAVYDQFLLNVDFKPVEPLSFYTQFVADPWSWVGTTGEQITPSSVGNEVIRYNLKYFGAFNSTLNEIYRTNVADSISFPVIEVENGQTVPTTVRGFYDFNPATNGIPFNIPALDIDYEFRPIRKLWMDYRREDWHARIFALADESQALTTDDPLALSNHKDYWQQSPWLYQYKPIRFFSDHSIQRGFYDDSLSYLARDSEGHRLVLLRGASIEAAFERAYFAATFAAPFTPWDEDFWEADNVPGAARLKYRVNDRVKLGMTYTFRSGLINNSIADLSQVYGVDPEFKLNPNVTMRGEVAVSRREIDLLTDEHLKTNTDGSAYKAEVAADFDHVKDGHSNFLLSLTQMEPNFEAPLSRYSNTRDDRFWGKHLTFAEYSPGLEYFRLGDGVDKNRAVFRINWKEKVFKDRFYNLFDVRHVRTADYKSFKENVLREEATFKITPKLTAKGLFRWHALPDTTSAVEPFISDYYFIGYQDPSSLAFQNTAIPEGKDPSRLAFAGGLQYAFNRYLTAEGFLERTNDIPDFPRGLLNGTFRDTNDRVDGLLLDHLTNFLYGQRALGAVPPYDYFTITRERVILTPDDKVVVTFHLAQNSYKFAAGIDDNINHEGVGIKINLSKNLTFFFDYTHSRQIDVPKLIATNYAEEDFRGHHNFYASADWRLNSSQVFRAEYGVFGLGLDSPQVTPYSTTAFSLPTIDTEHLFRVSLSGDF